MSNENGPVRGGTAASDLLAAIGTVGGFDGRFALLSDARRRYVVAYLRELSDGVAEFDDLVDTVFERETVPPGRTDEEHRKRIAVALHPSTCRCWSTTGS
ncbi:hypothetical protein BRC81_08250 [Halobacteriales archaeon QS_1_68_20]|nr:MAG: hypothetical protein BRC81_08250 [Halobacteriales archaeon QS_1_68_20]